MVRDGVHKVVFQWLETSAPSQNRRCSDFVFDIRSCSVCVMALRVVQCEVGVSKRLERLASSELCKDKCEVFVTVAIVTFRGRIATMFLQWAVATALTIKALRI